MNGIRISCRRSSRLPAERHVVYRFLLISRAQARGSARSRAPSLTFVLVIAPRWPTSAGIVIPLAVPRPKLLLPSSVVRTDPPMFMDAVPTLPLPRPWLLPVAAAAAEAVLIAVMQAIHLTVLTVMASRCISLRATIVAIVGVMTPM